MPMHLHPKDYPPALSKVISSSGRFIGSDTICIEMVEVARIMCNKNIRVI